MHTRNPVLLACIVAAGTTHATAGIFTWFAGSGMWENPAMWNGPVGQYPDSILDTATISGQSTSATLGQNLAVGALNVLSGAAVYSGGNSIFVNADTQLIGAGSSISVTQTPSLRDFDTDTLTISTGILVMYNGLAQFDEALVINNSGAVLGTGTIEMNSTTGNLDLISGAIWAQETSVGDTLRITRTGQSTSKLNWTGAGAGIIVWDGKAVHNELEYTGALGGSISVSGSQGTARFISDHAFVAGLNSQINFTGGTSQSTARIESPVVDSYGEINVNGHGVIDSPFVALRGNIELRDNAFLTIPANLLIFDSLSITSTAPDTTIQLAKPNSTLNITGGLTSISLSGDSDFDLDGAGDKTVNIASGSVLSLDVGEIDLGAFPSFEGTLNIDGILHVESHMGGDDWRSNGEIVLDHGAITGRRIDNAGVIRGTGVVDAAVVNNGEIIADGGTLAMGLVITDGDTTPATGILRAQTGDLVMNMDYPDALHYFTGSAFVGNGSGVREVLQMDVNLVMRQEDGATGSMDLNSGFVVLHDFTTYGLLTVRGVSQIRTTGTDPDDRIGFSTQSINTIVGELEVDGDTWFVPGAQFIGEGIIHAVSTVKGTYFQDDSDLSDVGFTSVGGVSIAGFFADGLATMGSLTLEPTADLHIFMGDITDDFTSQKFVVHDGAHLDGTLILTWGGNGDVPVGHTVTVLQAANITGGFGEIDDSGLGFNRRAYVTVDSDSVEVFVTCSADLNADGQANFFDVSQFLSQFTGMDPAADLNDDGQFNFFDVSIFLSAFGHGC